MMPLGTQSDSEPAADRRLPGSLLAPAVYGGEEGPGLREPPGGKTGVDRLWTEH